MHSDTTIIMHGPLPRIVELAADVERWPEILPHYRWVTLLAGGGDRKVVEMLPAAAAFRSAGALCRKLTARWYRRSSPIVTFGDPPAAWTLRGGSGKPRTACTSASRIAFTRPGLW